jgi:hypothetical protein
MACETGCAGNDKKARGAGSSGPVVDLVATVEDEATKGPQFTFLASVKDGNLSAYLVEKGSDGRGKPRVQMSAYGARYPYSLSAAKARELGIGLIAGADALEAEQA